MKALHIRVLGKALCWVPVLSVVHSKERGAWKTYAAVIEVWREQTWEPYE